MNKMAHANLRQGLFYFFPLERGKLPQHGGTMGILDGILKGVGDKLLGGEVHGGVMEQVLGLINNPQTGGLSGLVEQFTTKGL